MQRAARLRGMTLTGYLIATAGEDARRAVEEADVLRLAAEDQARFAKRRRSIRPRPTPVWLAPRSVMPA